MPPSGRPAATELPDPSRGYEAAASAFAVTRSAIGSGIVAAWARRLPVGARVLDIGAGTGWPNADVIIAAGRQVHAIEPSPRLAARFAARYPNAAITQCALEEFALGGAPYDAALAIGVLFLLRETEQRDFIERVGQVIVPNGRFLFTAPERPCAWTDVLTARRSRSLGAFVYERLLEESGLRLVARMSDEAGNSYYEAKKP